MEQKLDQGPRLWDGPWEAICQAWVAQAVSLRADHEVPPGHGPIRGTGQPWDTLARGWEEARVQPQGQVAWVGILLLAV